MASPSDKRIRVVYICHPFRDDPVWNVGHTRMICRHLASEGVLPLVPHLILPQFMNEGVDRERAMAYCLRLVGVSDEVWVYDEISDGMAAEIAEARRLGIPVMRKER